MEGEFTEAELRRLEARWKSDVDLKLDTLIRNESERGEKYNAFLDMLIKREADRAKFRQAVIEKGVIALGIYFIGVFATLVWDTVLQHWKAAVDAAASVRK